MRVADGNVHKAVLCRFMSEDRLEGADAGRVLDVPPELTGGTIPEIEGLDENQLAPFNLSINMARAGDGDSDAGKGNGSIWRRLGEKSRWFF